jgi:mitochondrial chaperone BCS1
MDMSFPRLRRLDYVASNDTTIPGMAHLPTSILDAFIPGYSFISKYVLDVFGFDISIIVSILVLGFAFTTGVHYIYRHLWISFLTYFTASVVIDAYDTIYENLLSWAAEQDDLKRVRSLKVQSADYTDEVDELKGDDKAAEGAIFNFNSWAAKVPPRYEPDTGYHWFRHKGNWFKFSRESNKVPGGWMGMMIQEQEIVRLTVLGRSTKPIKDLILDTRDRNLNKQIAKTTVRRPSPKDQRGRGRQAWNKVAVRPSRPMGTVVLDNKQKAAILRDINDFLDPATTRWYSNRGIPYRRGILLHGPPGTGKTSLSFALAGVFGLDIYCMSLSEKTLSEEDLILLFNSLPKRCIVLLEDIDSAGVVGKKTDTSKEGEEKSKSQPKDEKEDAAAEKKDESAETTASIIAKEVAKAVKSVGEGSDRSAGGRPGSVNDLGITMSGLLNAIDGVASQEGRVLIMTTNYPEKLDDALMRPGRVDMKVEFKLASRVQIRELFLRMYCVDSRETARMPTNLKQIMPDILDADASAEQRASLEKHDSEKRATGHRPARILLLTPPQTPTVADRLGALSPSLASAPSSFQSAFSLQSQQPSLDLERMADKFAASLPETTFSPAEVQGYLIMRKKNPLSALTEVATWCDAELAKKSKKEEEPANASTKPNKQAVTQSSTNTSSDTTNLENKSANRDGRGAEHLTHNHHNKNNEIARDDNDDDDDKNDENTRNEPSIIPPAPPDRGCSALLGTTLGVAEDDSGDGDAGSDASDADADSAAGDSDTKSEDGAGSERGARGSDVDDDDDGYNG